MISIFIGKPRAGKTTYLAKIAYKCYKARNNLKSKWHYDYVFCNEPSVKYTTYLPTYAMGTFKTEGSCLFLMDECGIELNNRDWFKLPKHLKVESALNGHRKHDIFLFSQTVDIDITFRQRAQDIYLISKLGSFSLVRHILYEPDVNNETHELQDMYTKSTGLRVLFNGDLKLFYRPKYYKLFDSYVDDYKYPCESYTDAVSKYGVAIAEQPKHKST